MAEREQLLLFAPCHFDTSQITSRCLHWKQSSWRLGVRSGCGWFRRSDTRPLRCHQRRSSYGVLSRYTLLTSHSCRCHRVVVLLDSLATCDVSGSAAAVLAEVRSKEGVCEPSRLGTSCSSHDNIFLRRCAVVMQSFRLC